MQDGAIIIKAELDSSNLDDGLKQTEAKVTNSANNLSKIIKGVGFSALMVKAGKVAVDTAKKINDETERVMATLKGASTLYQGVAVDQEKLVQGLSAIAVQTGESLENLGQSVYDALSAGVKPTEDMGDVLAVVQKSAKLASAGFTDVSTALSATLKVVNAYGMGVDEVDRVQNILMQTQNSGITTVNELGNALAHVVPTASAFGVSFEDVGASLAEMTKQGTKTTQATTQLNAIISELGKNGTTASKKLAEASQNAGLSATSFQELIEEGKSLGDILDIMAKYADQNGLSMVDMFSSIDAGKGALQLSGSNLEDYSSILKSMGESAGLVSEAFDKTVDPSKKLEASMQTLYVTLGSKFKPTADSVRTILADTILKMSGQYSASSTLKDEIVRLESASKDLAKAQEEVGDNMTDANKAMLAQSRLRVLEGMDNVSKTYREANQEIDRLTGLLDSNKSALSSWTRIVQNNADKAGLSFVEYVAKIDKSMDDMNWFQKNILGLTDYQEAVKWWHITQQAVIEDQAELEQKSAEVADAINLMGRAVLAGSISLEEIAGFNADLSKSVDAILPKLKEEADAVAGIGNGGSPANTGGQNPIETATDLLEEFTQATEELTLKYERLDDAQKKNNETYYTQEDKLEDMINLYIEFVEKGLDPGEKAMESFWDSIHNMNVEMGSTTQITREMLDEQKKAEDEYKSLAFFGGEVGKSLASQEKYLSELEGIYAKYIKAGLDPTNASMESLAKTIVTLREEIGKQKSDSEELGETFSKLEAEYNALSQAGELNGKALYSQEEELKALTSLYTEFIRKGLDPTDKNMVKLKERIDALKPSVDKMKLSWGELGKTMRGSLDTMASGVLSSFSTLTEELMNKDKKVLELEKEIAEERSKLVDYTDDLADAEEDLAKAQARGNEKEIRDAQKKVDKLKQLKEGTESVIKSKEEEKRATDNTTTAWKAMGKSALEALASTLEGIGGQLAGLAVVHALALDWGGAGIATAGSATAFATAGVLRGYAGKFARGGIVEGDSYTGDRMLASVNAGELILSVAQQESLARALEASVALAEISNHGGLGGGITVNLDGATIYGLDEPAVGRAIYENIENLKHEGVI